MSLTLNERITDELQRIKVRKQDMPRYLIELDGITAHWVYPAYVTVGFFRRLAELGGDLPYLLTGTHGLPMQVDQVYALSQRLTVQLRTEHQRFHAHNLLFSQMIDENNAACKAIYQPFLTKMEAGHEH